MRKILQNKFHKLNKIIMLIMYFTGGEPFRISEVVGLSFNDINRSIYFRGEKMIVTFTYNETDNIRNDTNSYLGNIQQLLRNLFIFI